MMGPIPSSFWGSCAGYPRRNGNGQTSIVSSAVTVPLSYSGLCVEERQFPQSPEAEFQLARAWIYVGRDYASPSTTPRIAMCQLNPSAGVYTWPVFDEFMAANTGRQITITLGCPANYLVSRAAIGRASAYLGSTKLNMCPDDLVGWAAAVTAVADRAKTVHGRTGIIWQLWNEIDIYGTYDDSLALLGPYTKATAQALKAVDPTAHVMAPSIVSLYDNTFSTLTTYLNASDGAGGYARDWVESIAFHYYGDDDIVRYKVFFDKVKAAAAAGGAGSLPLYLMESGINPASPTANRRLAWRMAVFAALGCKSCIMFSWGGKYGLDVSQLATTYNRWSKLLSGETISALYLDEWYQPYIVINGQTLKIAA